MNKVLLGVLAASAATIVSAPAQAVTLVLTPPGADASVSYTRTFNFTPATPAKPFSDVYDFTTTVNGTVSIVVTTVGGSAATDVTFNPATSGIKLDGAAAYTPFPTYSGPSLFFEDLLATNEPITGGVTNFFKVAGTSGGKGQYTVQVTFTAAVPEAATWAMLVLGFGFVGAAMRYRVAKPQYRMNVGYA